MANNLLKQTGHLIFLVYLLASYTLLRWSARLQLLSNWREANNETKLGIAPRQRRSLE